MDNSDGFFRTMDISTKSISKLIIENYNIPISEIVSSDEFQQYNLYVETLNTKKSLIKYLQIGGIGQHLLYEDQGFQRILNRINSKQFSGITQFRGEFNYKDNIARNSELIGKIRSQFSSVGVSQVEFGFYKTLGYRGECSLRDVPYQECPEDKKISKYEESMLYVKSDNVDVWDFLHVMILQGKLGDQDGVLFQLTPKDQTYILNTYGKNKTINYSMFRSDRGNLLYSHLSDSEFNDLLNIFPSDKSIYEFVKSNISDDSDIMALYYCKSNIDSQNQMFEKIGDKITVGNINYQYSLVRKGSTSKQLNNGVSSIGKEPNRSPMDNKQVRSNIPQGGKEIQSNATPFVVENYNFLGISYPQSETQSGYNYFKSCGMFYD